jgi:hypothetical protein
MRKSAKTEQSSGSNLPPILGTRAMKKQNLIVPERITSATAIPNAQRMTQLRSTVTYRALESRTAFDAAMAATIASEAAPQAAETAAVPLSEAPPAPSSTPSSCWAQFPRDRKSSSSTSHKMDWRRSPVICPAAPPSIRSTFSRTVRPGASISAMQS